MKDFQSYLVSGEFVKNFPDTSYDKITQKEQQIILEDLINLINNDFKGMAINRNTEARIKNYAENIIHIKYGIIDLEVNIQNDNGNLNITLLRQPTLEEKYEEERLNKEFETAIKVIEKNYSQEEYNYWVKYFQSLYGQEIGEFLAKRAAKMIRDTKDRCIDNHRVAEVGNLREELEYQNSINQGCCGFVDEIVIHYKTGRKFRLGFNHGH